jgi:hypothetical protein
LSCEIFRSCDATFPEVGLIRAVWHGHSNRPELVRRPRTKPHCSPDRAPRRSLMLRLLLPSTRMTCPQSTHCMRRTAGRTAPTGGLLRTTFIRALQRGHGASLISSSPQQLDDSRNRLSVLATIESASPAGGTSRGFSSAIEGWGALREPSVPSEPPRRWFVPWVRRGSEVFARVGEPRMLSPSPGGLGRLPFWEMPSRALPDPEECPASDTSRPPVGSAVNKGQRESLGSF